MKFQATITGAGYGYVYVMSYPGSDKLKIGHSLNPTTRAADIGGTLAPEMPILEAYFWCSERREDVERKAHEIEQGNRYNGEWFSVSIERAVEIIRQAGKALGVDIQMVFDRSEKAPLECATHESDGRAPILVNAGAPDWEAVTWRPTPVEKVFACPNCRATFDEGESCPECHVKLVYTFQIMNTK